VNIRHVLLVEPEPGGHHFIPYLLYLVRALRERQVRISLLTTEAALDHPAMQEIRASAGGSLTLHCMPRVRPAKSSRMSLLYRQWRCYRTLKRAMRRLREVLKPDLCVLMHANAMDRVMGLLGSPFLDLDFVTLTIHLKFHWSAMGISGSTRGAGVSRWLFERALADPKHRAALSIDESLLAFYTVRPEVRRKLHYLPDPGQIRNPPSKQVARSELGIAADAYVILIYGGISERKNVSQLLALARRSAARPVIVLAGAHDQDAKRLQREDNWQVLVSEHRLHAFDGFLSVVDEARVFACADVAWIAYHRSFHAQSAVLPQACSMGMPVLAKDSGLIGYQVRKFKLGVCFDPHDDAQALAGIERMAQASVRLGFRDHCLAFAARRSEAAHRAVWQAVFDRLDSRHSGAEQRR
jgi:glycosyltransferase involved in cell wall biosynthesis